MSVTSVMITPSSTQTCFLRGDREGLCIVCPQGPFISKQIKNLRGGKKQLGASAGLSAGMGVPATPALRACSPLLCGTEHGVCGGLGTA